MDGLSAPGQDPRTHWDAIYTTAVPSLLSWHQQYPRESLELVEASGIRADSPIIDVGGGASVLADCLLHQGYSDITVLDCSRAAIEESQHRLGSMAEEVKWRVADIRYYRSEGKFTLWHDRALFHFMVEAEERRK